MKPNRQSSIQSSGDKFKDLLKNSKVFRDPVHGDIWITELEKKIIDNLWFQRLRKTRQLGPTNLVYPGANHTRFEHSIGTVFVAQQIIDSINKNNDYSFDDGVPFSDKKISNKEIFIIRLIALLHDCAHVPFGHTLESEGNILGEKYQMEDDFRRSIILSNLFPIIRDYLVKTGVEIGDINEILGDAVFFDRDMNPIPLEKRQNVGIIESVLVDEESGKDTLQRHHDPYIAEIVGNTICADLLDYLKRDAYYTGLEMTYDPRILSFFVIKEETGSINKNTSSTATSTGISTAKPSNFHVAILLEKKEKKSGLNLRRDVLSSCVDLLHLRYSLAEKVYTHRVKTIVSAMVIKCIYCAINGGIIEKDSKTGKITKGGWEKMMLAGDDALINEISLLKIEPTSNEYQKAAKKIADAFLQRKLYVVADSKETFDDDKWRQVKPCCEADHRYALERRIENVFDFPEGSIILYAPKENTGKEAKVRMYIKSLDSPIITLEKLGENVKLDFSTIKDEIDAINARYRLLWKYYVLLDKDLIDHIDDVKKVSRELIEEGAYSDTALRIRAEKLEARDGITISATTLKEVKATIKAESDPRDIKNIDLLLKETEAKRSAHHVSR
jgi:uncharacterized protein